VNAISWAAVLFSRPRRRRRRTLGRRLLALSHPALHLLFLPVQCIEYPLGILWRDLSGARLAGIAGLSFLGLFRLLLFGLLFLFLLLLCALALFLLGPAILRLVLLLLLLLLLFLQQLSGQFAQTGILRVLLQALVQGAQGRHLVLFHILFRSQVEVVHGALHRSGILRHHGHRAEHDQDKGERSHEGRAALVITSNLSI
jgi:hypothetical protein